MDNLVFGKYIPFDTFIHRLDPRGKLLAMILLMVSIFLSFDSYLLTFIVAFVHCLLIFILMIISKIRFKDLLFELKGMIILIIVLLVVNILVPPLNSVRIIFETNGFVIYLESFLQTGKIVLRLFMMLGLAMVLTSSTTPQQLTDAFSFYLTPLKKIKFPVEEVSMTMSIALRFIPTLLEETNRIYKAQASRGVDFKHGNIKARFVGIMSLVVPLFVSSFLMSDELAYALEARGYNPRASRTKYRVLAWKTKDTVVLILSLLYMGAFIALSVNSSNFINLLMQNIDSKIYFVNCLVMKYF